jgi:hypothetical protein
MTTAYVPQIVNASPRHNMILLGLRGRASRIPRGLGIFWMNCTRDCRMRIHDDPFCTNLPGLPDRVAGVTNAD